jgi:type I restriction enzyme S subunit
LGLDDIKSVDIPLPPVREQKAIVDEIGARLSIVEKIGGEIAARLQSVDRLKQSILSAAFSGRYEDRQRWSAENSSTKSGYAKRDVEKRRKDFPRVEEHQSAVDHKVTDMKALTEVLRESSGSLAPEELLVAAGYSIETIDEFYAALRSAIDTDKSIEELRPNDVDVVLQLVT